jgi:hypothetical protein
MRTYIYRINNSNAQAHKGLSVLVEAVLRIREDYPEFQIRIRPFFGIPDTEPTFFYAGSRIRILKIREGKNQINFFHAGIGLN